MKLLARRLLPLALGLATGGMAAASASSSPAPVEREERPAFQTMWEMIAWYSADYDMDGLQAHLKQFVFMSTNARWIRPGVSTASSPTKRREGLV
jgi:hypothetical protein